MTLSKSSSKSQYRIPWFVRSGTLERYITHEFIFTFIVCFLFYFFIFFLNQVLLMAQDILAKGIPVVTVLLLMVYAMPTYLVLTIPFATLNAALMSFGRFSSENEILAMRSVGFTRFTIFRPVLVLGILLAVTSFIVNDNLLPVGLQAFQRLWLELTLTRPGLELEENSVREFREATLITGSIDKTGIHPLIIIEKDNSGNRVVLMADRASPEVRGKLGKLPGFRLHNVFSIVPDKEERESWSWTVAETMEYRPLSGGPTAITQQSGPAAMRVVDLRKAVLEKKANFDIRMSDYLNEKNMASWTLALNYAALNKGNSVRNNRTESIIKNQYGIITKSKPNPPTDQSLKVWLLEYYQKYAVPFSCIPFVILSFPLGLLARRSGRAVGFFIGLLVTSLYWSSLVVGRSLGLRSGVSPFMTMIVPNVTLFVVAVLLFIRKSRI